MTESVTHPSELRFYQTEEQPCGYLADRKSSNVFVDPKQTLDGNHFSFLSAYGFRRSGPHVYRPRCAHCSACQPMRVVVSEFIPSRNQRRCIRRNEDLQPELLTTIDTDECYALYQHYIEQRHADGEMYPPTRSQYQDFLSSEWGITRYIGFRDPTGKLISIAVVDCLHDGLSAMYSFFSPEESKRSLGMHNILYQIRWAQDLELSHLYLGYLIDDCAKMQYKSQYRPYELLKDNQWLIYR